MLIRPGDLDRRVVIQQPTADAALDGAGSSTWAPLATVWAQVVDMLPSRAQKLADGINVAARPAQIRIRYRTDVTSAMRFVLGDRVMRIVAGPAELGRREGLEFMVEDYTSAGNG